MLKTLYLPEPGGHHLLLNMPSLLSCVLEMELKNIVNGPMSDIFVHYWVFLGCLQELKLLQASAQWCVTH
jgi:hypothetical protein